MKLMKLKYQGLWLCSMLLEGISFTKYIKYSFIHIYYFTKQYSLKSKAVVVNLPNAS